MSPDDIFAAQFWPWPDPAIKRDMEGRVLFVNAAFLAIYGGRVEDWRGHAVGGWPAPQPASQGQVTPYRFETRLPDGTGGEQVYDWIEQSLADGNAFALARNVTIFTQSPDPDPSEVAHVPPAQQPQQEEAIYQAEPAQSEDAAYALATTSTTVPAEAPEPPVSEQVLAPSLPDIPMPEIDIPTDDHYALTQSVPETHQAFEPELEAAPASETLTQEAPREFERRALPLEAESAVLGNNWRDAVIAKAVGAEDAASNPDAPVVPEIADITTQGSGGAIRILLAEDNAINALLTRTLLEAEGHTVDTVEDGALAVEAMKSSSYDLIFMDMRMPNMDGLEATRKIRTLPNVSKDLPIIALTANAFDDDRNACFDSGMNDFMTKPVSAEELSEMVAEWTGPKAEQRLAS
ncbi:response regulator [Litorimonas sp. WD9-15]|uniref:response regulator n=1 Tax=Litorimonas sp. WD9-15 TaxID=3418716 RepID=UPI003D07A9A7